MKPPLAENRFTGQRETLAGGLSFFVGTGVSIGPKSSINLHFVKGAGQMNGCINKTRIGVLLMCFACVLPAEGNSVRYLCPGFGPETVVADNAPGIDLNPADNIIEVHASCSSGFLSIEGIAGPTFTLIAEFAPGESATTTLTDAKFINTAPVGPAVIVSGGFFFGHNFDEDPVPPGAATIISLDGTYNNSTGTIIDADIALDPFINEAATGLIINPPGGAGLPDGTPFTGTVGPVFLGLVFDHGVLIDFTLSNQDEIRLPTSAGPGQAQRSPRPQVGPRARGLLEDAGNCRRSGRLGSLAY